MGNPSLLESHLQDRAGCEAAETVAKLIEQHGGGAA